MKPGAGSQDANVGYKEGDEVFYQAENGQSLFGTIGQVKSQKCQVVFGDGTEKWSPYGLLRKLSFTINDEEKKETPEKKTRRALPNVDINCISCGSIVSGIRAPVKATRHSDTNGTSSSASVASTIFRCSGCIAVKPNLSTLIANKLSPAKPGVKLESAHANLTHHNSISLNTNQLRVSSSTSPLKITLSKKRIRESEDVAEKTWRTTEKKLALLNSSEPPLGNSVIGKNQQPNKLRAPIPIKIEEYNNQKNYRRPSISEAKCFHCAENTTAIDRVTCNLCQRPCHQLCLNLKTTPVQGDRFWDVMCDACGTQKAKTEKDRVFSVRRNLTSWADLAYIILNCLTMKTSQRFFEIESSIVPFLEKYNANLHLPRMFKILAKDRWKETFEKALNSNGKLFMNGREVKKKVSFWGIRTNEPRISSGPSSSQDPNVNHNSQTQQKLTSVPKVNKPQVVPAKKLKTDSGDSKPIIIHSSAQEIIDKEKKGTMNSFIRLAPSPTKDSTSHPQPSPKRSEPAQIINKRKRESIESDSTDSDKTIVANTSTSRVLRPPQPKPEKTEAKPGNKEGKTGKEEGQTRAIKSATIAPPPTGKIIKIGRPKKEDKAKPNLNDTIPCPGNIPNQPRGRGRPKLNTLDKKQPTNGGPIKRISTNGLKPSLAIPANGHLTVDPMANGAILKEANFNPLEQSLFVNALYGSSRIECLPEDPKTIEKYLSDKKKLADIFNSDNQKEREVRRKEEEYFLRSQGQGANLVATRKNLRDEDSYEVIGRRVDEDGLVRVLVRYKGKDEEEDEDEEEEQLKSTN